MRVLVAGGDGFCGWPTALYPSAWGREVSIADNMSRRGLDEELGTDSLTRISTERLLTVMDNRIHPETFALQMHLRRAHYK